jgi:hypothetical protein
VLSSGKQQSTVLAVYLSDLLFDAEERISTSEALDNFCHNCVSLKLIVFLHI